MLVVAVGPGIWDFPCAAITASMSKSPRMESRWSSVSADSELAGCGGGCVGGVKEVRWLGFCVGC